MRKSKLTVAAVLLCGAMLTNSCVGSFTLFNKFAGWNTRATNSKFLNELLFLVLSPAHVFCLTADALVLNTIEFWSGSNPVAQGRTVIDGADGRYYVDCDGKGYTITSENDGSKVRLDFDSEDRSWSVSTDGSEPVKFMTFIDDSHVKMLTPDGDFQTVELSQAGVYAYRQMVTGNYFAMK